MLKILLYLFFTEKNIMLSLSSYSQNRNMCFKIFLKYIVFFFCNLLLLLNIVLEIIQSVKSRSRLFIFIAFSIQFINKSQFFNALVQIAKMNILAHVLLLPLRRVLSCRVYLHWILLKLPKCSPKWLYRCNV